MRNTNGLNNSSKLESELQDYQVCTHECIVCLICIISHAWGLVKKNHCMELWSNGHSHPLVNSTIPTVFFPSD